MEKVNIENNMKRYYMVIAVIFIVAIIIFLGVTINKNSKQELVQSGTLEHTEILTSYIVKKEQTISKEQGKVIIPIVAEGSRISKGDIIATYMGEEYTNYEETLNRMDKEILEHMKDLPVVYSSEVSAIDDIIHNLVKDSIGETSYNKMQQYKKNINTQINKRANIIGELSPSGAEIKKLIKERNEYGASAKKSNDNILSPMPGIISYSVDTLEDKLDYKDIDKLSYEEIKKQILDNKQVDNTKIKVVNNYEAWIVMKAKLDNEQYIEEGCQYRLRIIEKDNYEFVAKLEKVNIVEDGIEVYFKVTNGIENIVDLRETEIEVVWNHAQGLIVPVKALNKYENSQQHFVTAIKYGEYENIPVNIRVLNENYALVKNYSEQELTELGIKSEYELLLYDRIIINSNDRRNT